MASSEHANAIPWRWIETTLTLHLMKQGISQKNQHLNPASFRINIKRKGDECHLALPTTTLILSKAVHVIDIHFMRIHKQSATNKFKACLFDHSHNLARNDRPKHLWWYPPFWSWGCSKLRLLADQKILHSKSMNQDINMLTSTFDIRVFLLAYPFSSFKHNSHGVLHITFLTKEGPRQ